VTSRDRIVLAVVALAATLAAAWFVLLAPKRGEVARLDQQIAVEQQRLDSGRASAAQAVRAKATYRSDYAVVAGLGKAVPVDDQVPSLLDQLERAADGAKIDFRALKLSGTPAAAAAAPTSGVGAVAATGAQTKGADGQASKSSSASTATSSSSGAQPATATQAAASTLPPGATVGSAGFPTMPFVFSFEGSFASMRKFIGNVQRLVRVHGDAVQVGGRLMTIDGFALTAGRDGLPQVRATLTATTYLLPGDQGLTSGATPAGPAATPGAPSGGSSGGAAPATTTATATATGVK